MLLPPSCVTLHKSLSLSVPRFLPLCNGAMREPNLQAIGRILSLQLETVLSQAWDRTLGGEVFMITQQLPPPPCNQSHCFLPVS